MDYAIEFNKLTKSFSQDEDPVLNNIDFKIHRGQITTILGFSGAGKSTLMKHVLGLLRPTSGDIIVLGENLGLMSEYALREFRQNFGMLFQYAALFDSLTTYQNIAFPLREFANMDSQQEEDRVFELLKAVGLSPNSTYKFPAELSGGMRKRVGLARALALEPDIMLYDEPTTGLDPITTKMVNELIRKTAKANIERQLTSVIISHDIQATLKISDYIAFLDRGKVVVHLPVDEFVKTKNPVVRGFLDL